MSKRKDDRDADKSYDKATEDPWEAQKTDESQQAAELQVGEERERGVPSRFEPDAPSGQSSPDPKDVEAEDSRLKEDSVDEP
ncbi:MAG TPA: hypothetical protein VNI02_24500 [Blastocatellia bacterium]|jgi:hypothetical protein|nr:hypothetical protein [Blastocatellia bacterium]